MDWDNVTWFGHSQQLDFQIKSEVIFREKDSNTPTD